ncbi:hypothetical protein JJB07_19580 [Tumebacillus sp. ITR2]|uniref:Uncharacterized protein n=1 Tax=Tumebacillus amylolyticus TaxID=2801339 RepID=A0ABS1JET3_9BACL|nr:hypothetical protein [Tumebacillus amylolyticus]MBL0388807.1 hypothetical protein [Tumebacillus amylolyticus]
MKKFLRILPFFLVFVVVYGLMTYWETTAQVKPFLEPFGRSAKVGTMTPNRPVEAIGDNRYAYLNEQNIVLATLDPATQQVQEEKRPLPNQDIYSYTNYKLLGDDLFWIGKGQTLKWAKWQGTAWSQAKEIATKVTAIRLQEAGGKKLLFAGGEGSLNIYEVGTDSLNVLKTFPQARVSDLTATLDDKGVDHIGIVDQISGEIYKLTYATLDTKTWQSTAPVLVTDLSMNTDSSVDSSSFGLDQLDGYFLISMKIGKLGTKTLNLYSFPLSDPSKVNHSNIVPMTQLGEEAKFVYGPVVLPGVEQDGLKFAFIASTATSPRFSGNELYLGTLQNGAWKQDATRISNIHKVALNPVVQKKGSEITTIFTEETTYETFDIYATSNNPTYAAASNQLTSDDFKTAAMQVPVYLGSAIIQFFVALAWPCLSYVYLMYFVLRREDELYERASRHFWIAVLLYLASQIYIFLSYGNLANWQVYAPEWLHSNFAIALLFLIFGLICYLFTLIFRKTIYERNAIVEFSYFTMLNLWLSLIGVAYFMSY